ncbi:MAG: DUF58 domain-containing protein [Lachnospiraceae bacterium]|nr:DUF58 domain-containing protein [Lachnospiraceae bacterium]
MKKKIGIYGLLVLFTGYEAMVFEEFMPTVLFVFELFLFIGLVVLLCYQAPGVSMRLKEEGIHAAAGEAGILRVLVKNASVIPLFGTELQVTTRYVQEKEKESRRIAMYLPARREKEIEVGLRLPYCGRVCVSFPFYRVYDCLGLLGRKKRWGCEAEYLVRPKPVLVNLEELRELPVIGEDGDSYYKDRSGQDNSEIYQVRDYRAGDRLSAVHWKLSARTEGLLVKEFSRPKKSSYLLVLDNRCAGQEDFHRRLTTLLSISCSLAAQEYVHTVAWFDYGFGMPKEVMVQDWEGYGRVGDQLLSMDWKTEGEFPLVLYERFFPQVQYVKVFYVTGTFARREADELARYRGGVRKSLILTGEEKRIDSWPNLEILQVAKGPLVSLEEELKKLPVLLSM